MNYVKDVKNVGKSLNQLHYFAKRRDLSPELRKKLRDITAMLSAEIGDEFIQIAGSELDFEYWPNA